MKSKLEPERLLAKSYEKGKWKGSYSLVGHTADVVEAVTTLVDTLGEGLIAQFGLACDGVTLRSTARLAAYLHDWGKANDHFQILVRGKRDIMQNPQLIRHELASMLLAWEYREWLRQCPDADFMVALSGSRRSSSEARLGLSQTGS
ncbi:MAG: CRISPR-associated endonuclease Cas3'' [Coleofasciculaceae cyanobacterium SM2_1_6]|nr:CRISPR-associated endonuclease Cas3'' [Coleofasciculaceae cyanobacterium SM2_1_6]